LFVAFLTTGASAQMLIENFNYTSSTTLGLMTQSSRAWFNVNSGDSVLVDDGSLNYTGYPVSVGNKIKFDGAGTDPQRTFTAQTSGTIYYSFLVKSTSLTSDTSILAGTYFTGFRGGSTSTFGGCVWLKKGSTDTTFYIGVSPRSSTGTPVRTYAPTLLYKDSTILVVVAYKFMPGATNDSVKLWINPVIGSSESTPDLAIANNATIGDLSSIDGIFLRQDNAATTPSLQMDELRVGTSWSNTVLGVLGANLTITPKNYNFGGMGIGSFAIDTITLKNVGYGDLSVSSVTSNNSVFTVTPTTGSAVIGDNAKFIVTYAPSAVESDSAAIVFTSNNISSPDTVVMKGTGTQPSFQLSAKNAAFGIVLKDSTKIDSITVTNASTSANLVIDSVISTNPYFTIVPKNATIGASSSAKFAVECTPTTAGATSGNIVFYHNAASKVDTLFVGATCVLKQPLVSISKSTVDYSVVQIGKSSIDSVVVKNVGYDSLIVSNVTSSNGTFVVTPMTARLDTNASQKFYITFTPTVTSAETGKIVFTSNAPETSDTVAVSGSGIVKTPVFSASKTVINYANVFTGESKIDSIIVHNTGTDSLIVSSVISSNGLFTVTPLTARLDTNASKTFYVTFAPLSAGSQTGTVVFTSNASNATDTVNVSGTSVVKAPVFSITKTSLSYPNIFFGASKTDSVIVKNLGYDSLIVSGVASSNGTFTVTPLSARLDTNASQTFYVTFTPAAAGSQSGTVVFASNASEASDTVRVSGTSILKAPIFSASKSSFSFYHILMGSSSKDSVTVKNIGYDSLIISNVSSSNGTFTVTPLSARLDTNASQKFYVTFAPTAAAAQTGPIIFASNVIKGADTLAASGSCIPFVTIGEARKDANSDLIADHSVTGDTIAVSGIVISPNMGASSSQTSYYVQDSTGGVDVFAYSIGSTTYTVGDTVWAVGTIAQYRGLVELKLLAVDTYFKVVNHGTKPKAKRLSLHQFLSNPESYECQLIEIDTLSKGKGTWPAALANSSMYLTNSYGVVGDTVQVFLDKDASIYGTEPVYPINVVGVVSQYTTSASVYNNGYELSPRDTSDIIHTVVTSVDGGLQNIPTVFSLSQNYPNPFNPSTTIGYSLPLRSSVTVKVYSILGQEVATLVNSEQGAGYYQAVWNASRVASGVYLVRISAQSTEKSASFIQVKKMILMK
jgi:hypothetical protein